MQLDQLLPIRRAPFLRSMYLPGFCDAVPGWDIRQPSRTRLEPFAIFLSAFDKASAELPADQPQVTAPLQDSNYRRGPATVPLVEWRHAPNRSLDSQLPSRTRRSGSNHLFDRGLLVHVSFSQKRHVACSRQNTSSHAAAEKKNEVLSHSNKSL